MQQQQQDGESSGAAAMGVAAEMTTKLFFSDFLDEPIDVTPLKVGELGLGLGLGKGKGGEEREEKVREEGVAALLSSGKGRNKRQRDEEEEELLREENSGLREEIELLRAQLQLTPHPAGFDAVAVENRMLRQSLLECKSFIRNCLSLAVPTEAFVLKCLAKQGADFAFNHVLNVIASSQNGQDWKPLILPPSYFFVMKPGEEITMSYRSREDEKGRAMLDLRFDGVITKVDAKRVMNAHWKLSLDTDVLRTVLFPLYPFEILNAFSTETEKEESNKEEKEEGEDDGMQFRIYREFVPAPGVPFDCAVISAYREQELALSTLLCQPEQTPLQLVIRDQHTPLVHTAKQHTRKMKRRKPTASTHGTTRVGDVNCQMLVYTTSQYTMPNASTISHPTSHHIQSLMTVGYVSWDDEAQIEVSIPIRDENGVELVQKKRERVPATRTVGIGTIYDDEFCIQELRGMRSLVSKEGVIEPRFASIIEAFTLRLRVVCGAQEEST